MAQAPTYPNEVVIPSLPNRIKDDLNSGVIPGCFGAILGGLTGGGGEATANGFSATVASPAGTPVQTPEGSRAIETIKAGEQVWSYDLMARPVAAVPCVANLPTRLRGAFDFSNRGGGDD